MSIGIITSIKSIKEIIWPNFLTYQKYYDLCRSKVTAPNLFCEGFYVPNLFCKVRVQNLFCKVGVQNLFCEGPIDNDPFFGNAPFAYLLRISLLYSIGKHYISDMIDLFVYSRN